jgi:A/G-specific adenine glycosylase
VSEIMLQQTRVDTVVPYYERFLVRFPDVRSLAAAPIDDVLHHWQGLGYYRRARQLHRAAGEVVDHHAGEFPRSAASLRGLSGIGPYTAGAIASIAFDAPAALVDGNVARVLARRFGIQDDIKHGRTQRELWRIAQELVDGAEHPGAFNQGLMELGATVCTPRKPRCEACPLRDDCVARALDAVARLPVVGEKKQPRRVALVAAVVEHGKTGRVLFAQRQADGLFGGLWEPPMVAGDGLAEDARAELRRVGIAPSLSLREVGTVTHLLTHRRLDVTVSRASVSRAHRLRQKLVEPYVRLRWAKPDEVALSTLARRVLDAASAPQESLF